MARPKTIKDGQKLNLYVPKATKRLLFKRATEQGKSISAVVTDMINNLSRAAVAAPEQ